MISPLLVFLLEFCFYLAKNLIIIKHNEDQANSKQFRENSNEKNETPEFNNTPMKKEDLIKEHHSQLSNASKYDKDLGSNTSKEREKNSTMKFVKEFYQNDEYNRAIRANKKTTKLNIADLAPVLGLDVAKKIVEFNSKIKTENTQNQFVDSCDLSYTMQIDQFDDPKQVVRLKIADLAPVLGFDVAKKIVAISYFKENTTNTKTNTLHNNNNNCDSN